MNNDNSDKVMKQLIDLHVNPLAQVVTQLAAALIKEGSLTKDQAIYSVASAVSVIKPLEYPDFVKEDAASTLHRMVTALQGLPD